MDTQQDQEAQIEPLLPTVHSSFYSSVGRRSLRNDDEAVVDRRGTRSQQRTDLEDEDVEGHRTLYIGVHVPFGSTRHHSHRRHRHHGNKHKRRSRERDLTLVEDTPSQRVQLLLGTEDNDEQHIPHNLFTEMDEICVKEGEDSDWRESARWLKFEEDVEDGGERWSKPYVATLSLHSLFELRSCIINSTVLLDMRANTIEEIADMVLDHQELYSPLGDDLRKKVRETLLKQHHHQNQKKLANRLPIVRSIADMGRRASELHLDKNGQMSSSQSQLAGPDGKGDVNRDNSAVDFSKIDLHFMKKIPTGAETCNVLVGELEFLNKPVVAFVRLSPAVLLSGLAEVPVATRFLFILLGPFGKGLQYHEIGRSMATLMTDEVFHDVAYKAKDRNDLIAGIDEFLDQVTVLPPGEWDPTIRIEPPKNVPSQEKRKKSNVLLNGLVEGEEEEEQSGHGGPELQRTGKWFGGLFLDIKRKAPHYLSDYTDAFSLQCVASFLFLYCACMSPVITFGGLLGEATEGRIDCVEKRGEFVGSACSHHGPYVPDVLFWCVILFFSTVLISAFLKDFKFSNYFPTKVRSIISDFAVFFAILTMVLIDYALGIPSPKLKVPSVFKPTRDDRGWFINPLGPNPWWTAVITVVPALLCTILIFMDQQITAVIINRKEHKLKLFDRLRLFAMPAKHQPDFIYLRHVPLRKVHLFTIIQLSCLILLWVIKTSRAAIVFPMMVLALVFIRKLMDCIFTKRELSWLDDLMPESKKKKLEDAEEEEEEQSILAEDEGAVQMQLEGYKGIPIINITDEMSKGSFGNTWDANS
ncbi:hypothetical protein PAMA_003304 [Pampus argenteus]